MLTAFFFLFDHLLINLTTLDDEQILTFRSRFLALSAALMKHRQGR